jgi:hypothetical protein
MQPRPARDLPDREPTHEVQPPNLSPFLHSIHLALPRSLCADKPRGPQTTGHTHGPAFNRRRWPSPHPASTNPPPSQSYISPLPQGRCTSCCNHPPHGIIRVKSLNPPLVLSVPHTTLQRLHKTPYVVSHLQRFMSSFLAHMPTSLPRQSPARIPAP